MYLKYYLNILEDTIKKLEKHEVYATENLFQIKKNSQNAKLNKVSQNNTKNHLIDVKIFNSDES